MATNAQPVTEAEILAAVIAPQEPTWPAGLSRMVLDLRFTPTQVAAMTDLAQRNNAGELTDEERAELASYVHVGNFLSLAHSKARLSLNQCGGGTLLGLTPVGRTTIAVLAINEPSRLALRESLAAED